MCSREKVDAAPPFLTPQEQIVPTSVPLPPSPMKPQFRVRTRDWSRMPVKFSSAEKCQPGLFALPFEQVFQEIKPLMEKKMFAAADNGLLSVTICLDDFGANAAKWEPYLHNGSFQTYLKREFAREDIVLFVHPHPSKTSSSLFTLAWTK